MSKEQTDLAACPFCGSDNAMMLPPTCRPETPYNPADRLFPIVRCGSCCAEVSGNNEDYRGHSAIAAWNRRASPSPAGGVQAVKVKPLEWDRDFGIYAETPFGNYVIYPSDQNHPEERLFLGYDELSRHGSVSEAKSTAQSDYETRILSALSSQAQTTGGVE